MSADPTSALARAIGLATSAHAPLNKGQLPMNAVYSRIAVVIAVGIFCLSQIAACGGSPTPAPVVERSDLAPTETEVPSRAAATDIDTFYNEFRLGEWIPCIETPREVWAD